MDVHESDEVRSDCESAAGSDASGARNEVERGAVLPSGDDAPVMSKKALKREQRRQAYQDFKKIKKQKKKEAKREERAKAIADGEERERTLHPQDGQEFTQRKRVKKETFVSSCASNFHVIIDCSWENEHSDASLASLTQQIMFCYGIDRRAAHPVALHISGMGPRAIANLSKVQFQNWAGVTHSSEDYLSCPTYSVDKQEGCKQLVYLTSDATDTLDVIDPDCAYVIGGIVDRNRLKGITYEKATAQGVRTVKLPIQEHYALKATPVLTVNHVFDILLTFAESKDWVYTLGKVLPKRKEPTQKGAPRIQNGAEDADKDEEEEAEEADGPEGPEVGEENGLTTVAQADARSVETPVPDGAES